MILEDYESALLSPANASGVLRRAVEFSAPLLDCFGKILVERVNQVVWVC